LSSRSSYDYTVSYDSGRHFRSRMSLQDIVVMIHNGEYGRAIASLENDVRDETMAPVKRVEYCTWLAECNRRLEDYQECGNWYVEAVRIILGEPLDPKSKATQALPICEKALDAYQKGGDAADVLVAARLKQYLVGLAR
jgi:hypothetical protein